MSYTNKFRAWVFTWNNYTPEDEQYIKDIIVPQARYLVYGKERAPDTGTPHLQGYVYFESRRQRKGVHRLFKNNYVNAANGTTEENFAYVSKDGNVLEFGDKPMSASDARSKGGQGNKRRYEDALANAKKGKFSNIEESDPQLWILHGTRLESLYTPDTKPIDGDLQHEWWVGASGTGKSRLLWELYPTHYGKSLNKWWDGYKYEDVVAIEEWSPKNDCTASSLKIWADRYPFKGEIKGGCIQKVRPTKIIVLSNYSPHQCFINSEDLEPILRRFTVIEFPRQLQNARDRAADFIVQPDQLDSFFDLEFDDESELPDLDLDILEDHT